MGCVPYPRLPMYWRAGTKLGLICNIMSRDRFLTLRNALHVVEGDSAPDSEKGNVLWKVQPMIDKVKDICNKLERVPGFYSIDEQMIPFTGRCKLRQVVKNKPRPVGLKNFVMTTSEGLMLDFAIYEGAKTMFGESNLGLGPSVILSLAKSIPPGSCVYHDRYFTTVPLIEEMEKLNLHSTGTIMQNRIPDRATIKFKKDSAMRRGECQQFVCEPTVLVKWKDNKSVLLASNCTGASHTTSVKRWDKTSNSEEIRRL
ncbi:PiggyBac transposable element-derived protein 3 [Eumeta japonica]|uniref:PiggyBac transposable element-derived protein 3 n=1 Tax=Eumeta variegata TaxID=151549 RepID=A0A4C1YH06_EUMVA|nr:PiggyBac transposable element-derived protein 3 [Eumeta japonica]